MNDQPEYTLDEIERGLAEYVAGLDLDPARMFALMAEAINGHPDQERVRLMIRRGAQPLNLSPVEGSDERTIVLAYTEAAEWRAAYQAAITGAEPLRPPAPGSEERGARLILANYPIGAVAAVPRG